MRSICALCNFKYKYRGYDRISLEGLETWKYLCWNYTFAATQNTQSVISRADLPADYTIVGLFSQLVIMFNNKVHENRVNYTKGKMDWGKNKYISLIIFSNKNEYCLFEVTLLQLHGNRVKERVDIFHVYIQGEQTSKNRGK